VSRRVQREHHWLSSEQQTPVSPRPLFASNDIYKQRVEERGKPASEALSSVLVECIWVGAVINSRAKANQQCGLARHAQGWLACKWHTAHCHWLTSVHFGAALRNKLSLSLRHFDHRPGPKRATTTWRLVWRSLFGTRAAPTGLIDGCRGAAQTPEGPLRGCLVAAAAWVQWAARVGGNSRLSCWPSDSGPQAGVSRQVSKSNGGESERQQSPPTLLNGLASSPAVQLSGFLSVLPSSSLACRLDGRLAGCA